MNKLCYNISRLARANLLILLRNPVMHMNLNLKAVLTFERSGQLFLLGAMILFWGYISLFIGVADLGPFDIFSADPEKNDVLILSRIPRLLAALCTGMTLSVAGVIMQHVMANRFVSPSTGSTMDWARLGVLLAVYFFPAEQLGVKMLFAASFAFGGSMLFVWLLRSIRVKEPVFVPLIGIMLGNVVSAVTIYIAYKYNLIQNISSWFQGSFTMVLQGRYELLYIGIPLLFFAFAYANRFTIVSAGKEFSFNLGVPYSATVTAGILIASVITAVVVVTVGIIPFVGVIVPNVVRLYRGDNLKTNLWEIMLTGGLFVLVCDIISRLVIYPFEVPVSITVGIIGSAVFLYLLLGRKEYAE